MSKQLEKLIEEWGRDAYLFVEEALGVRPDHVHKKRGISNQQKELLDAASALVNAKIKFHFLPEQCDEEEKRLASLLGISVMSGKGTGKDACLAWIIIWLLVCFPAPKIPCTAPTGKQLNDVLWAEIRKWIAEGDKATEGLITELIEWQSSRVKQNKTFLHDGTGFASARTCAATGTAEEQALTLQGFHADVMMVGIDESSGVPDAVYAPLEGTLTGYCNFIISIFNPNRNTGFAIENHTKQKKRWITLHWDAEKSTNVTPTYIQQQREKYGENSNMYRINVKGLPPKQEEDVIIPLEWVQRAVNRDDVVVQETDVKKAAADAGAGGDKTTFVHRKGMKVDYIAENDEVDTMKNAEWIAGKITFVDPDVYFGDNIGVGQGIHDRLKTFALPCQMIGIKGSNSPKNAEMFRYLIDELWWKMRAAFEKGIISIPDDEELITELSNRKWYNDPKGRIKIETKLDMKKRGIRSPNKADALAMTFYTDDIIYVEAKKKRDKYERHQGTSDHPKNNAWMLA